MAIVNCDDVRASSNNRFAHKMLTSRQWKIRSQLSKSDFDSKTMNNGNTDLPLDLDAIRTSIDLHGEWIWFLVKCSIVHFLSQCVNESRVIRLEISIVTAGPHSVQPSIYSLFWEVKTTIALLQSWRDAPWAMISSPPPPFLPPTVAHAHRFPQWSIRWSD